MRTRWKVCVKEGLASVEQIGWTVMIKGSQGGGRKGIRKCDSLDGFNSAFHAVAGEITRYDVAAREKFFETHRRVTLMGAL